MHTHERRSLGICYIYKGTRHSNVNTKQKREFVSTNNSYDTYLIIIAISFAQNDVTIIIEYSDFDSNCWNFCELSAKSKKFLFVFKYALVSEPPSSPKCGTRIRIDCSNKTFFFFYLKVNVMDRSRTRQRNQILKFMVSYLFIYNRFVRSEVRSWHKGVGIWYCHLQG